MVEDTKSVSTHPYLKGMQKRGLIVGGFVRYDPYGRYVCLHVVMSIIYTSGGIHSVDIYI